MSSTVKAAIVSVVIFAGVLVGLLFLMQNDGAPPADESTAVAPPEDREASTPEATIVRPLPPSPERGSVGLKVEIVEKGSRRHLRRARVLLHRFAEGTSGELVRGGLQREGPGVFSGSLPPGTYNVRAQCPNYSSGRETVTLVKDMAPKELVFELSRGNSISGRILTRGGEPIAGANVFALKELGSPDADLEETLMQIVGLEEMQTEIPEETVSDQDGFYQLDGLDPVWYTVRATAANYSPEELLNVPAPSQNVDLTLTEGGSVAGVVQDSRGTPIEGAVVQAYPELEDAGIFDIILVKSRPPVDQATTDSGGRYQLTKLGAGLYNYLVKADGYQVYTEMKHRVVPGSNAAKVFTLKPGAIIRGMVVGPDDQPLVGAKVRPTQIGGGAVRQPDQVAINFGDGSEETDENGLFLFDTLSEGTYMLLAWHEEYQSLQKRDVRPSDREVILKLKQGSRLTGTVVDAGSGRPIAGATVSVSDRANLRKPGTTDAEGRYFINGIGAERRSSTVYVTAPGYARGRKTIQVQPNRETIEDFELQPTATVSGVVVNSAGDAVPGARVDIRVSAETGTERVVGHGTTDRDGSYVISDVEPGEGLKLRVKKSTFLETYAEPFSVQAGEELTMERIVLEMGGEIHGSLVGADGRPVNGAMVTAQREGDTDLVTTHSQTVQSGSTGEFVVRGLESGMYDLIIKAANYVEMRVPRIEAREHQRNRIGEIQLELGGVIAGRVIDQQGAPVGRAEVLVRDFADGVKQLRTVTDASGSFRVGNISAKDSVEVEVTHTDYSTFIDEAAQVGTTEYEVVLATLGRIQGIVVDASGDPVGSYTVQPQPEGGDAAKRTKLRSQLKARTFSPADGRFDYGGVPDGLYTVYVRSPTHSAASIEGVEIRGGQIRDLGEIQLRQGGVITGSVVDAGTGDAVSGARVRITQGQTQFNRARSSDPNQKPVQVTGADGSFKFTGLKDGNVTLEVTHASFVRQNISGINTRLAEKSQGLVIELEKGGEITGVVVDASGAPRSGMSVYLIAQGGAGKNQSSSTNARGRFHFRGVAPGSYDVKAHQFGKQGAAPTVAEARVELPSGGSQDVLLELRD